MDTHPEFEALKNFVITGQPESVGVHVENCERCSTITDGLNMLKETSENSGQTIDQNLELARARTHLKFTNTTRSESKQKHRSLYIYYGIAASTLILGLVLYLFNSQMDPDLFVREQILNNDSRISMTRGSRDENVWISFVSLYNQGNYGRALEVLEQLNDVQENPNIQFYIGLCQMLNADPDFRGAIEKFDSVRKSKSRFNQQARWYLALCLYSNGQLNASIGILKDIMAIDDHYKSEAASRLLRMLEN